METARPVVTAKGAERLLKYLDPEKRGVLRDDLQALQYALCFFVNCANLKDDARELKHKLSLLPLKSGGALLAMQVIHLRCAALSRSTAKADAKLRHDVHLL